MINDRLQELKRAKQNSTTLELDEVEINIESNTAAAHDDGIVHDDDEDVPEDSKFVNSFFNMVGEIKHRLQKIQSETEELKIKYNESLSAVKSDQNQKEIFETLRSSISANLNWIKSTLEQIDNQNKKMEKEQGDAQSSELRIRINQFSQLSTEFSSAIQKFAEVQSNYKEGREKRLVREIKAIREDATDEEIQRTLEDPSVDVGTLFGRIIMNTSAEQTAQTIYDRVSETRDDLLRLEDSMNEVTEMFRDLHALVISQQPLIDNIEHSVTKASNYVKKARTNIQSARKTKGKSRVVFILILCAFICLALVIIIIIVLVLLVLIPLITSALGLGLGFGLGTNSVHPTTIPSQT